MRKIHPLSAVVVASTLALVGCGGDGDGDSTPEVALTAITEANAAQVSSVVFEAASVLFDVASSSGALPVGAVVSAAPAGPNSELGLASFAARQLKAVTSRPLPGASGVVGVVIEETYQCSGGGTVTERIDDADNNQALSTGDSVLMTFFNCVEEGLTSNGVLAAKFTLVTDASLGGQVTFSDFVVNDGTDVIGANGGFDLTITENAGVSEVYEIAGDKLVGSLNSDQHTLTGFTGAATKALGTGTVTYTFRGRVSDSSNNIAVDAETISAFVTQSADDYPGSGSLRSIGAGNSQALLEALSSTDVRISADAEGDGSFTTPVVWSWSALEALPD
jgi:hypothetical protein